MTSTRSSRAIALRRPAPIAFPMVSWAISGLLVREAVEVRGEALALAREAECGSA
jgi:hypothetical protein